jgi:hypothetical protein
MTWAQNSSGAWVHTGTNREGILWDSPSESLYKIEYQFERIADEIMILAFPSPDGRSGLEVGIASDASAVTTKLTIRTRTDNTPSTPVYQADHNIPADTPFTLTIEVDNGSYRATIKTTGVDAVTLPTEGMAQVGESLANNTGHAFFSDVDGATVVSGGTYAGEPAINVVNSPLVAWAKGNGGVYYREVTDTNWQMIRTGCFSSDDEISRIEYEGKVLFLAWNPNTRVSRAWKVNIPERTCTPWTATNGTLPGSTGPGLTTARLISSLYGRVIIDSDGGIVKSALPSYVEAGTNAEDDWLNDPSEPGSATLPDPVGTGRHRGSSILGFAQASPETLLVFKTTGIFARSGDQIFSNELETTVSLDVGISGPKAIAEVGKGTFYVHAPEGAHVVSIDGALPLSKPKLRRYMDIGRNAREAYNISVQYDSRDALVYFFLTQKVPTAAVPRLHPVLDLQTSEFLLDEYNENHDPLCACWWNGRLLKGDRDGYCRWFAPFGESDDGYAFTAKYTALLEDLEGARGAFRLTRLSMQLGTETKYRLDQQTDANAIAVRIYGGETAEDAILPNRRTLRAGPMIFSPGRQTHLMNVADHALAIEVTGTGNGFDWFLEDGTATLSLAAAGFSEHGVPRRAATPLCRPAFAGGTTPTPNVPPVANAGADQTLTDTDLNGEELVHLDGSRSADSDGTIVRYQWTDSGGNIVGTTAICDVYQLIGVTETYTLKVWDDDGATDTDTCTVTVNSGDNGGGGPVDPPGGGTSTTPGPTTGDVAVEFVSNPTSSNQSTAGGEP